MWTGEIRSARRNTKLRVGLIGCGTIGCAFAEALQKPPLCEKARLVAVCDAKTGKAVSLARRFRPRPKVVSMEQVVRGSDMILEAASPSVVPSLLRQIRRTRRHLLVMSTAGLLEAPGLLRQARRAGCPISVPSGALVGIDGVKAFSGGSLQEATLTTRKPPQSFGLNRLRKAKVLFEGPALKAVRAFPQNINVAATVVLAGVPLRKLRVKIIADPTLSKNTHELSLKGREGHLLSRAENLPSRNPKTSRLAILSATATLRQLFETVHIGT